MGRFCKVAETKIRRSAVKLPIMIVVSHTTALYCMRHLGAEVVSRLPRVRMSDLHGSFSNTTEVACLYSNFVRAAQMQPAPLHVLRPYASRMGESDFVKVHAVRHPRECVLVKVAEDVYLVTPEMLVRQLAVWGDQLDLIQLIYELCGTYGHPRNSGILLSQRAAFATRKTLEKSLSGCDFPGVQCVRDSVKRSNDRSASHMETACAMMFSLPYRMGGLGFPDFVMNEELVVPFRLQQELGRRLLYGDLLWRDSRVVFEYDSNQEHCGVDRIASDSSRRNVLTRMGFTVVTLTGQQINQRREFLRTAGILANALGHRIRPRCKDFQKKHDVLRWHVLRDQMSAFGAMGGANLPADRHPRLIVG